MGNIVNLAAFKKNQGHQSNIPTSTHDISLNEIKIRLIQYFSEFEIMHLYIKPVNLSCRYEKILLKIAALFLQEQPGDTCMHVAEEIYQADLSGLSLNGFIECINRDDLIMGCLQTELSKIKCVDRLFLINVLKSKFPQEETTINLMKALLFAQSQSHKLEEEPRTQRY